ncbi:hypothetical protein ACSU1N_01235 [Thermogladius sp. 4427co]|uniref:hypothetical protein n=1 Tax=Thermogladius sp. 4427co TaxID=3450718 RepID=UPI003F79C1ED
MTIVQPVLANTPQPANPSQELKPQSLEPCSFFESHVDTNLSVIVFRIDLFEKIRENVYVLWLPEGDNPEWIAIKLCLCLLKFEKESMARMIQQNSPQAYSEPDRYLMRRSNGTWIYTVSYSFKPYITIGREEFDRVLRSKGVRNGLDSLIALDERLSVDEILIYVANDTRPLVIEFHTLRSVSARDVAQLARKILDADTSILLKIIPGPRLLPPKPEKIIEDVFGYDVVELGQGIWGAVFITYRDRLESLASMYNVTMRGALELVADKLLPRLKPLNYMIIIVGDDTPLPVTLAQQAAVPLATETLSSQPARPVDTTTVTTTSVVNRTSGYSGGLAEAPAGTSRGQPANDILLLVLIVLIAITMPFTILPLLRYKRKNKRKS